MPILENVDDLVFKLVFLAVVAVVALVVQRIVVRVSTRALEAAKVPSASIFVNILRALVWFMALIAVLEPVFGVQPTAFVAALGVSSLVISFGMQDTISNVVAGLGLMVSKVIQPGDVVSVGGVTGKVADITWRSTVLAMRDGSAQVIPNSVLNTTALTKLAPAPAEAASFTVGVAHGTDPALVEADVLEACKAAADKLDPDRTPAVNFASSDAYGVYVSVVLFLADGVIPAAAINPVMRGLAQRPWIATAVNNPQGPLADVAPSGVAPVGE